MGSLRDKYKSKSVKISDLKKKAAKEDSMIGSSGTGNNLELEEGTNKIRFFPPHEEGSADFYVMKKQAWITVEKGDGEMGRRTVPNSRYHGGTKLDIIEEYLKLAKKKLTDKSKLKTLTDWKTGLSFDNIWMAYAIKIKKDERKFGIIEFKKSVRDAINKELFIEDEDDPIEVDPFTDIDEGLAVLIKYNKKPNKKKGEDYYTLSLSKKPTKLKDEELEIFDKAKPLTELLKSYTLEDFELALEGLENYDTEREFDLFEEEEWVEIVEKVRDQYEEMEEEEEEDDEDLEDDESEDEDLGDEVDEDDDDEEEEEDYEEVDEEEDEDDEVEEDEEEEKPKKPKSKKKSTSEKKMTLDEIRAKLKKKKSK